MPITHTDGKEYFSQAEMETAIKDRVKTKEAELDALNGRIKAFEPQLAQVQALTAERDQWKGKASEAEARFSRYQAAASHGITDPDTIEALEGAYQKTMGRVEESKRTDFDGYLNAVKADPALAPSYLRGVFQGAAGQQGAQGGQPGVQGQAVAGANGQPQGAQGQPGAQGGGQNGRPAWAPAGNGQVTVTPGTQPDLGQRIAAAASIADLEKIQNERRAPRAG